MYISKKINLMDMNKEELRNFFVSLGENAFRADQVMTWIYRYYCDDFSKMMNLSKSLRIKLSNIAVIRAPIIVKEQISFDGTRKWSMQVENQQIETVYIPENMRATVCVSSQVGCALGCRFCGTAQQGFNRNLRVSEIIGQIWRAAKIIIGNKKCCMPITHVVFMGMGEPLLNLTNVVSTIKIILDKCGLKLSKRHIIVSTVGIVPAMDKLKDMIDVSLAISLHASNDVIRDKIMPINRKYNISSVLDATLRYLDRSTVNRRKVTIEYVLLDHVNDESTHAHQLVERLKNIPCKVNLIPWNPIKNIHYTCSANHRIIDFFNILLKNRIITTVRKIRGGDINAACGQLTGEVINRIVNVS